MVHQKIRCPEKWYSKIATRIESLPRGAEYIHKPLRCTHNTSKKAKTDSRNRNRSLKSLDHATDHSSGGAVSVLLEPSNEGLESVGLLSWRIICGCNLGRLGLSWGCCGRCGSFLGGGRGSRVVGSTFGLDALGVVWVPLLAFEACGA
jgi:hypothetical protein